MSATWTIVRPPALSTHGSGPIAGQMPVVIWSTPQVEQALVGELNSAVLLELARVGSRN